LQYLDISENNLDSLPLSLYSLTDLKMLNISHNHSLTSLDSDIVKLTKLRTLGVYDCHSLTSPPFEVLMLGMDAVRQYYS